MAKSARYTIPISHLSERQDGSLRMIRDASRQYHKLLKRNINKFSKSGKLLASWKFELFSETKSSVYSNAVYARIQDQGGKIKITNKMRNFAWYMFKKTGNKMWKAIAITKKSHIQMPSKGYSQVNLNIIKKFIERKYERQN